MDIHLGQVRCSSSILPVIRSFFILVASLVLVACGGGGSSPAASGPSAPTATIDFGIKQLTFSWPAVSNADYYKLLENADGASGFSVIQNNITTTSASKTISVVNHDWANARYMVEACNSAGCTGSVEMNTVGAALKAVGFIKASNTGINDQFSAQNAGGYSGTPPAYFSPAIALSGDGQTLVVGAEMEDGPDQGISTDQLTADDGTADNSGAVYVFRHGASGWSQQAYIKASDAVANGRFGKMLTLSQDGNTLAVTNARVTSVVGGVYIFRFAGSSWSEETKLSDPVESTDTVDSLALDDSGNILFVGRPFATSGSGGSAITTAGAVSVYRFDSGTSSWGAPVDVRSDAPQTNALMGLSLSASGDGAVFVTGANGVTVSGNSNAGAAYVFRYNTGSSSWAQEAVLSASNPDADDNFGRAVGLSRDGSTIAVSALKEDGADTGVSNGGTGDMANGSSDAGAVYVYRLTGGGWTQQAYIKATNTSSSAKFGGSLALSRDGNRLVVSAYAESSSAKGIGGDQSNNSMSFAGAAYQYQFDTTTSAWDTANIAYIKSAYTFGSDRFGRGLALSDDGNTLAVSSDGDDSSATGVATGDNRSLADSLASGSGAVYLY